MIWPNGPAKVLKSLEDLCSGSGDQIEAIVVSRNNFYMVMCTKSHIGLFRLKPFAPTCIIPVKDAQLSAIFVSHTGRHFAVQSGRDLHIYQVHPTENFDEILKPRSPWTSTGPGEALGVRELGANLVKVISSPDEIVAVCPFQEYFVIVNSEHMHFSSWNAPDLQPVHTGTVLDGRKVTAASHSALLSRLCLLCDNGQTFLVHLKHDEFRAVPLPDAGSAPEQSCFNLRFAKVVVAHSQKLVFYSVKDLNEAPLDVNLPAVGQIELLEWAPSGLGLLVGHETGWCILSALGMVLYSAETRLKQCDWSVSGDELFLLTEDGTVLCYEIMRLFTSCRQNISTPIFHSGNRVVVYNDASAHVLPDHPWVTVPLPNHYLAQSWPIISACMSSNGKYAALAGSYGLVYLSVSDQQWKLFAERDVMVRANGIVWYNNCLILSTIDEDHKGRITKYSTAVSPSQRGFNSDEEQPISTLTFSSPVVTMSVFEQARRFYVLTQDGNLFHYDADTTLKLISQVNLLKVLQAPGRVRAMTCLNIEKILILIDDRLILVTLTAKEITRRTIHAPVEYHYVHDKTVWAFSGDQMVITRIDDFKKSVVDLEDYPVGINIKKGLISTVESHLRSSFDHSYDYIELFMDLQVYLPSLFDNNLDATPIAQRYCHLNYFDDVMESALYHALVEKADNLGHLVEITKQFCDWKQVVVRCARKIEVKYWATLFSEVKQSPEQLFAESLDAGHLSVAAEYLMVLQAQFKADPGDSNMIKLFQQAMDAGNFDICKQLSEFLLAIDGQGTILRKFGQDLELISPS